jgi:hypothetical protein
VLPGYRTRTLQNALDQTIAGAAGTAGPKVRQRRQVSYQWQLREQMAAKGMFTASELVPLFAEPATGGHIPPTLTHSTQPAVFSSSQSHRV